MNYEILFSAQEQFFLSPLTLEDVPAAADAAAVTLTFITNPLNEE